MLFSALMILSLTLTGCGPGAGGKIKIRVTYWGDNNEIGIIESIVKPWEKAHPNIKVDLIHIPTEQYLDKVMTMIAGGEGPDVLFCEVNNFVNFYLKDVLLPLDDMMEEDEEFDVKEFYPQIVSRFTRDNQLYVIPRDIAPFACIYYNKDMFNKENLPYPSDQWTTDDMIRMAKQLTKVGEDGMVEQYGLWINWLWPNLLYTFGGGFVDDFNNPKRAIITSQKSRQALKLYYDTMYTHNVSPQPGAVDQSGGHLFQTGRLALYASGIWESPEFRHITDFDWDIAMFPKSPDGHRGFGSGGSGYAVYSKTKYPREAWEVVKCLTGDEGQIRMADTGLAQPAKISLARGEHWAGSPDKPLNKKMLDEATKYIQFEPFHEKWPEINREIIQPNLDYYFVNKKELSEVLADIEGEMKDRDLTFD